MKEFTIDLHDGRGNQVYVLKIDQLAALEVKVKEKDELIDHLENTILNPGEDINERGTATVLNQDYWFICSHREKKVMNERIAALEAVVKERNLEWESIRGQNIRHATVNDELKERIAALTADAPTINKKLLKEFMMMIIHCDEEVNKDGLCNCAWQIGQVLQKLERKNKRLEAIVEILELEKGILQE